MSGSGGAFDERMGEQGRLTLRAAHHCGAHVNGLCGVQSCIQTRRPGGNDHPAGVPQRHDRFSTESSQHTHSRGQNRCLTRPDNTSNCHGAQPLLNYSMVLPR
jgi:hypothetical protein